MLEADILKPMYPAAVLPGDKTSRLRFVTAGEDKSLFLWTRSRSKGEVKTDPIAASHSSMITGLDYLSGRDWLVSGSKDKRVSRRHKTSPASHR